MQGWRAKKQVQMMERQKFWQDKDNNQKIQRQAATSVPRSLCTEWTFAHVNAVDACEMRDWLVDSIRFIHSFDTMLRYYDMMTLAFPEALSPSAFFSGFFFLNILLSLFIIAVFLRYRLSTCPLTSSYLIWYQDEQRMQWLSLHSLLYCAVPRWSDRSENLFYLYSVYEYCVCR